MNIRTRHLLAVALATALASPIVAAQEATGVVDANGNANAAIDAASQDTPPRNVVEPDPALPPQVNPVESAQQAATVEADPAVPAPGGGSSRPDPRDAHAGGRSDRAAKLPARTARSQPSRSNRSDACCSASSHAALRATPFGNSSAP